MKNLKFYTFGLLVMSLSFVSCNREENLALDKELINASADIDLTNELDFKDAST